ncbi:LuxR C-terminal-related transcriptional regulator [Actinoplanes solisilvae]|uniref:LuxR C-terminal-related transcriptional regulator n=1 Tax=Actinoplanes solisilvae TaxID=2486853 RepID=UPI000FD7F2FF|nr:LuxR C-terminal-related transcriptional regulator [Actinoplanes solisilvae]
MTSPISDLRFAVPPLPPHHVCRERLLETIDEAAPAALTLVCAGAGAGKTVLLADWARQQRGPVVWLALTSEDNEPRRFWRLFLEGGRVGGQNYPPTAWTPGRTIELIDSMYARVGRTRLSVVLDDGHVLTDPEIIHGLDRIVGRWSHAVRLFMTARSDPLLPLHRYRVADQVREIRATDLAMTVAETRRLLDAHGIALPDEELRTLTARTEGWPAGLRLAALRMQEHASPEEFVALFASGPGSVTEYLTHEVLAVQPERIKQLLVETSFLDEVTGPLADAVTGLTDSGTLLADLARSNSFVIPVDAARTEFRFHRLFREVLRRIAERQPPARQRERFSRAAAWYRARHDLSNALRWTIRSLDPSATRSLLLHGGLAEVFVTRQEISPRTLRALTEDGGPHESGHLEFDVAHWAITALTSESSTAAAELAALPTVDSRLDDAEPDLIVTARVAELILADKADDLDRIDRSAEILIADDSLDDALSQVPGLRATVVQLKARSRFAKGQLTEAEPLLRRALALAEADDVPAVRLTVLSLLAFVCTSMGRLRHADEILRSATELTEKDPDLVRPAVLDMAIARRAELKADWPTMHTALQRVRAGGPVYSDHGIAATVAFLEATYLIGCTRLPAARDLLRHNAALANAAGSLAVLRDRELAEVEIQLGRPQHALRLLSPHRRSTFALMVAVTSARAHLALDELGEASACTRAVLTTPSPMVDRRMVIEAMLCDAEITERGGSEGGAAQLLDRALDIAHDELVLPFVRSTATFEGLLNRHPTVAARWPAPRSFADQGSTPAPGTGLVEVLTVREQAVLLLMPTTMSTAEIAEQLRVSANTVKTHLAAIYRKLGVGRRRDAVLRARELEIL